MYINYTKCIQKLCKTLNLCIFCIQRLHKSKFLYDNECTKNVHQISTYIQKNVQTVQNLYKVQTKNGLKIKKYVFCTYKQCTNYYTKPIKLANWNCLLLFYVHKNNVATSYTKPIQLGNRIIYAAADICFLYTKPLHSFLFEFLLQQRRHLPFYFAAL